MKSQVIFFKWKIVCTTISSTSKGGETLLATTNCASLSLAPQVSASSQYCEYGGCCPQPTLVILGMVSLGMAAMRAGWELEMLGLD
jgi:hypothetical protein